MNSFIVLDVCCKRLPLSKTLYSKKVYRFTHIDDEVNYIACQICKLVKYGVDINKIKLIISDNEYINIVKRVFKMYNIPVNLNEIFVYTLHLLVNI